MKKIKNLLYLFCILLFSCSDENTLLMPSNKEETTLRFSLPAGNPTDFNFRAESAELVVSGSDLDPLTFPLTVSDSRISGTITAAIAGKARTFTISVYDSEKRVQYRGSLTINVEAGAMTSLPIRVEKVFGGRMGDSLALVAIDNATDIKLWDWETPIHTWPGVICESLDTARVTGLTYEKECGLTHIPAEIGYLTEITNLYLRDGSISQIPTELSLLKKLKTVDLTGNSLTSVSTNLCKITSLETLILNRNTISEISSAIDECTRLKKLDLSNNKLSGTFALSKTVSDLSILVLTNNSIDSLDPAFCSLPSLQELYLEQNNITELPYTIGAMSELLIFKLSGNQLERVPEAIWNCSKLQHLELQQNKLTALPDSLGMLPSLLSLNVEQNQINSLGKYVSNFQKLQNINLSRNLLQFGELERITLKEGFKYDPQDTIGTVMNLKNQSPFQIGITVTGTDLMYQWYRDDTLLTNETSDSLFIIQSGTYHCVISSKRFVSENSVTQEVKPMELIHQPIVVTIEDAQAPVVKDAFLCIYGESANEIIGDTCFDFSDNITPKKDIKITITKLPSQGFLAFYNQKEIAEGFSFTLSEYDSLRSLKYTNVDSSRTDTMGFTLTDYEGNVSNEFAMPITYF